MGFYKVFLEYTNECINNVFEDLRGKRMLELGNQEMLDLSIPERTGKAYFRNRGAQHISVDLNGLDGALPLDLTKPKQFAGWHNYFDIVTNMGTTEHVEPRKAQYECFSIIHDCLKVGGVVIHLVPDIDDLIKTGFWKGHSFNYYSHDFFKMLCRNNNYKLLSLRIIKGHICCCLQKEQDCSFMKNRKEFLGQISRRSEGAIAPGINDRGIAVKIFILRKILFKLKKKIDTFLFSLIIYSVPVRHRLGLYRWWMRAKKRGHTT